MSVGWFSPGWLPLSDHPGQKTQRKILGFKPAQREAGFARPTDSSDRNNKQEYLTGSVAPIFPFKEVQMIKGRIELFSNDSNKLSCFSAFFGITALY